MSLVNLIFFDGAIGTILQNKGLKLGENPEIFNIEYNSVIEDIHKDYIKSGSNIITTNTFGANELKLQSTPYTVEEIIESAINIAKKARLNKDVRIALDIGPIGELLEPMGTLEFNRAYEIFKRQIVQGVKSGADLILIETMTDLYEAKAAVLAAKENSSLPIFCTMSFENNGRTFTGCTLESMVLTLEGLGVSALGINCSLGPKELEPLVKKLTSISSTPIILQPNAGLPQIINGKTTYNIDIKEYGYYMEKFFHMGVSILGGCCGTTPMYIKEITSRLYKKVLPKRNIQPLTGVCTPSTYIALDGVTIIGERINPTGKKLFKEALIKGNMDYILNQAIDQVQAGAHILDVNVGLPEINEKNLMIKTIKEIQGILNIPLQIDSSDSEVIQAGLRHYNGTAVVNSVNGEDIILNEILPIVSKYGASVIGLTLDNEGIPETAEKRLKIAEKIVTTALKYGIRKENVFIDCLVLTASAQQKEVQETLKALRLVKENLGVKTVLGISNISFGLPNRKLINETFLALALGAGLDLPIINPNAKGMIDVINAYNVLLNNDKDAVNFINAYSNTSLSTSKVISKIEDPMAKDLKEVIIKGLREESSIITKSLLSKYDELYIVNNYLIPALDYVGEEFEKGSLFLPQLISSAETVKQSFEVLKENLIKHNKNTISKGKIILATVKGDIHDIGKNIVKVILENYGYEIIDLGKDVSIETIVQETQKHNVKLVGLSALMTTTLKSMEDTIKALKANNIPCKVFVGGAVLTNSYAQKIGADFFAKDAKEAVEIAKLIFR